MNSIPQIPVADEFRVPLHLHSTENDGDLFDSANAQTITPYRISHKLHLRKNINRKIILRASD